MTPIPSRAIADTDHAGIPTFVQTDRTLRVKIIDACGMTCLFCHNEGTPVVADNRRGASLGYRDRGPSGRVSIYLGTNGAGFLPRTVAPEETFTSVVVALRDALAVTEVHLTGGEPTLHPQVAQIVRAVRGVGLRVCMTSNGENGARVLPYCGQEGLDRVNFSVFGMTAEELVQVQHQRYADVVRAQRKIEALRDSVRTALACGIKASANIVVPNDDHAPRVRRLLAEHSVDLAVRLLNSLAEGQESIDAIERILADLSAVPIARYVTAGASGSRTAYRLPDGRVVMFKQIRPVRLPKTCAGCRFNNETDCEEGFYGVRLYRDSTGGYPVGVCIQRMDLCLPVEEFLGSDLCREILALRDTEYRQLTRQFSTPDSKGSSKCPPSTRPRSSTSTPPPHRN
ncbi:MAG: molybdenum cofactor biosynthesis enzyme [Actinobacteria bacterium 13_2_20CM_2_71_6]|nr:MAG: molybdenum cofactor biosynthesis enzyme [Actinobacteria bacterium 13_2_20CM_2_71_6]